MVVKGKIGQSRAPEERGEVFFSILLDADVDVDVEEKNTTTYLFGRPSALGALPRRSRDFPVREMIERHVRER